MEKFFNSLNNSRSSDRYKLWENHRKSINYTMKDTIDLYNVSGNIIIFGSGNCDDIDFTFLDEHFSEIHLVDIDRENLQKSVDKLDKNIKDKIIVMGGIDITGLQEYDFFNKFRNVLETGNLRRVRKFLIQAQNGINNENILEKFTHKFDMVATSAMYSQIFYPEAMFTMDEYKELYSVKDLRSLAQELKLLTNIIVDQFNLLLKDVGKEDSYVIGWTDVIEFDERSIVEFGKMVSNPMKRKGINHFTEIISKFGNSLLVGSDRGVKGLMEIIDEEKTLIRDWLWPFSENKIYLIFGITGKIKK